MITESLKWFSICGCRSRKCNNFASHVRETENNPPVVPDVDWLDVASSNHHWAQVRGQGNLAWSTWSKDVEAWLTFNGYLQSAAGERPLGSLPTLRTSTHHMAPCQPIDERQLRRWIRRLAEARMLQQNGHAIRPQLLYKLTQARVPDSEKQAVQNGAWGFAYNLARDRLDEINAQREKR